MAGNISELSQNGYADGRVFFDAVLHPHRSLSPRGFRIVMGIFAVGLLTVGLLFFLLGAWPVVGFCGLEFLLLYIAFKLNYRDGRSAERIRLSDSGLEISRLRPDGGIDAHWSLPANWMNVDLADPPDSNSPIVLSTHGRRFAVGRFLSPEERQELAAALRDALDRWRTAPHPRAAG